MYSYFNAINNYYKYQTCMVKLKKYMKKPFIIYVLFLTCIIE